MYSVPLASHPHLFPESSSFEQKRFPEQRVSSVGARRLLRDEAVRFDDIVSSGASTRLVRGMAHVEPHFLVDAGPPRPRPRRLHAVLRAAGTASALLSMGSLEPVTGQQDAPLLGLLFGLCLSHRCAYRRV